MLNPRLIVQKRTPSVLHALTGFIMVVGSLAMFFAPLYYHAVGDGVAMGLTLIGSPATMVASIVYLFTD